MSNAPLSGAAQRRSLRFMLLASTAMLTLVAGCSPSVRDRAAQNLTTPNQAVAPTRQARAKNNQLLAATIYWGGRHRRNPKDLEAAMSYAMNLKAMGNKKRAFDVLKTAHAYHPGDPHVSSEIGRLALDMNKVDIAEQMLERTANSKAGSDWRTLSARGALRAKKGEYGKAQKLFEAALAQKPDAPSLLNNLALAYALDGKAERAEPILRQAMASGYNNPKLRQNLALVLGLQGKFGEAKQVAAVDLSGEQAGANVDYLRNMVRDEIRLAETETKTVPAPPAGAPANVHLATAKSGDVKAAATSLTPPEQDNDWTTQVIEPTAKAAKKPKTAKKRKPAAQAAPKKKLPFRL